VPRRLVASSEFAEIWQTLVGSGREKKYSRARNRITDLLGVDYMRDSEAFFQSRLEQIRAEGRYRTFAGLKRRVGAYPRAYDHSLQSEVTVWCSNDYLGMGQHPAVRAAMHEAIGPTPLHSDPDILWLSYRQILVTAGPVRRRRLRGDGRSAWR
jgi:hypothetical protein